MTPRARLEEAARTLQPDTQGKLDGLCGIYATINGIRLALYPNVQLTLSQRRRLFITGVEALQRARLLGWVIHDGMSPVTLRRVSRAIIIEAVGMLNVDLELLPVFDEDIAERRWSSIRAVRRRIRAGQPLLVTLWGAYNHTTIACGFTRSRLQLFDSYGLRWVAMDSIRWSERAPTARHLIRPGEARSLRATLVS